METIIKEEGEQATFELGTPGIPEEAINLLGRLKYRTSYGQNVLQHSKEVAHLASVMAAELKSNVALVKRAGLLHDIGKAVSSEAEGSHAAIGAELASKFGESEEVVHAIAAHHADIEPQTTEAIIIQVADAISAARPGARRESLEAYIKRLERLENIANSFKGVDKSYAIQAGREIRVIIQAEDLDDYQAAEVARELAKKIENELNYPGQIKITAIREKRIVEYAR
jgi:ribonuclease Y